MQYLQRVHKIFDALQSANTAEDLSTIVGTPSPKLFKYIGLYSLSVLHQRRFTAQDAIVSLCVPPFSYFPNPTTGENLPARVFNSQRISAQSYGVIPLSKHHSLFNERRLWYLPDVIIPGATFACFYRCCQAQTSPSPELEVIYDIIQKLSSERAVEHGTTVCLGCLLHSRL